MKTHHPVSLPTLGISRIAVLAVLLGGLTLTGPLYAAPAGQQGDTQDGTMQQAPAQPPAPMESHDHGKMDHGPHAMMQHVEERIKSLHDQLKITPAQESKWSDVAQAMRDNEAATAHLVEERHQNKDGMTAIDDLQSYENIMQAHADGLKKLIPVFQALYEEMPEDQQKTADKVFGSFEGHGKMAKKPK